VLTTQLELVGVEHPPGHGNGRLPTDEVARRERLVVVLAGQLEDLGPELVGTAGGVDSALGHR